MSKTLIGAVATKSGVNAWYRLSLLGANTDHSRSDAWPLAVREAATALVDACDAVTEELDDVVEVQVYTPISDPSGATNADPGDCVDVTFRAGSSPQNVRLGEVAAVPDAIAAVRDAFKTAVQAAL